MENAHFTKANALFVDEMFEAALQEYSKAVEEDPNNAEFRIKRSACFLKVGKTLDALEDANKAVVLDGKNSNGYFRKGSALFELNEYESALQAFSEGEKLDAEHSSKWSLWIRKCKAELEESVGVDVKKTKVEETSNNNSNNNNATPTPAPVATATATPNPSSGAPKIRFEWYQTDSHVVVTVFCKGLRREQIVERVDATEYELTLKLPGEEGREWQQHILLAGEVVPPETRIEVLSTKMEMWLKKRYAARWPALERKQGEKDPVVAPAAPGVLLPAQPAVKVEPYAHKKKVNWDQFVNEQKDLDDDDPLNKVFKQIYGNGSEEQRRAMMKSYVESGGTVLSTNWEDVGKKKVEVSPPDGMIAKEWKSDKVVAEGGTRKVDKK